MLLANNDMLQEIISNEIKKKEQFLKESYHKLNNTTTQNEYLQPMLDDYRKYYNEKQNLRDAFTTIVDYLEKMSTENSLTKEELVQIKYDLKNVLKKKKEIDDVYL